MQTYHQQLNNCTQELESFKNKQVILEKIKLDFETLKNYGKSRHTKLQISPFLSIDSFVSTWKQSDMESETEFKKLQGQSQKIMATIMEISRKIKLNIDFNLPNWFEQFTQKIDQVILDAIKFENYQQRLDDITDYFCAKHDFLNKEGDWFITLKEHEDAQENQLEKIKIYITTHYNIQSDNWFDEWTNFQNLHFSQLRDYFVNLNPSVFNIDPHTFYNNISKYMSDTMGCIKKQLDLLKTIEIQFTTSMSECNFAQPIMDFIQNLNTNLTVFHDAQFDQAQKLQLEKIQQLQESNNNIMNFISNLLFGSEYQPQSEDPFAYWLNQVTLKITSMTHDLSEWPLHVKQEIDKLTPVLPNISVESTTQEKFNFAQPVINRIQELEKKCSSKLQKLGEKLNIEISNFENYKTKLQKEIEILIGKYGGFPFNMDTVNFANTLIKHLNNMYDTSIEPYQKIMKNVFLNSDNDELKKLFEEQETTSQKPYIQKEWIESLGTEIQSLLAEKHSIQNIIIAIDKSSVNEQNLMEFIIKNATFIDYFNDNLKDVIQTLGTTDLHDTVDKIKDYITIVERQITSLASADLNYSNIEEIYYRLEHGTDLTISQNNQNIKTLLLKAFEIYQHGRIPLNAIGQICTICQNLMLTTSGIVLYELDCKHIFHKDCLDHLMERSFLCPICRAVLFPKMIKPETSTQSGDQTAKKRKIKNDDYYQELQMEVETYRSEMENHEIILLENQKVISDLETANKKCQEKLKKCLTDQNKRDDEMEEILSQNSHKYKELETEYQQLSDKFNKLLEKKTEELNEHILQKSPVRGQTISQIQLINLIQMLYDAHFILLYEYLSNDRKISFKIDDSFKCIERLNKRLLNEKRMSMAEYNKILLEYFMGHIRLINADIQEPPERYDESYATLEEVLHKTMRETIALIEKLVRENRL